jgi:VanZ family protein
VKDASLRLALLAAVAVQCWALYVPHAPAVDSSLPLDKLVHLLLFSVVAALAVRVGLGAGLIIGLLVAQAVVSELVQLLALPQRSGDVRDVVADLTGVALGLAVGRWWLARPRVPVASTDAAG